VAARVLRSLESLYYLLQPQQKLPISYNALSVFVEGPNIGLQWLIVNFKQFTNNQSGPFIVDLDVKSELFSMQGAMQNLRTKPCVNEMHATMKCPMANSSVSDN
jgi:hypothetical protein